VAEIAHAAADRGMLAFGFTEHFTTPPHREFTPDGRTAEAYQRSDWIDQYVTEVQAARSAHAGRLPILLGTEFEYLRGCSDWTREQLAARPFDYCVGSVHFVRYGDEDICIDWDAARAHEALRRAGSPEQLHLDYYRHVRELLDWGIAHVIGHLDLIKLYVPEPAGSAAIRRAVAGVLETMRDRHVALDVNARGLAKPCAAIYPADWILSLAAQIGVPVTLGDDSHSPTEVGARLEPAVTALRRTGHQRMMLVRPDGELEPCPLPELA
jgi:histidinol-phosphatase (PHP family)